ncbi:hypothetical protein V6N12_074667 [Hibiscus sabdariffa]|uniref:Uncharacterized protein n=1 Tax=Hibiscus sabdariffa TaxID=183260 RepID=A0ABR2BXZ6_9ROSI
MMADLSSFGFLRSEILDDEELLWMVEEQWWWLPLGLRLWSVRVRVLVMKVEQGGSSSGCSMNLGVK